MPTADDELLSAIQSTPFKVSTVFKVNEGFNKDAHNKHKSNRYVRTHNYSQLLAFRSYQEYMNFMYSWSYLSGTRTINRTLASMYTS